MKKILSKILILTLIISSVFAISYATSYAQNKPTGAGVSSADNNQGSSVLSKVFSFTSAQDLVYSLFGMIVNLAMAGAGAFLGFCAYIFDVSMTITLNIKDFVNATPAIFSTWRILRDITGLAFIFYLIYAAIQIMTGWGSGSYGSTIKNIIIAGILVNFSFFITSVGIDASNVVSQALYNAILPTHNVIKIDKDTRIGTIVASDSKARISDIFMNSLRIQTIYDIKSNKLGTNINDPIKIGLIGLAGVVMMITTALSFLIASVAVLARTIVLIFLLAFSSMYWAGLVLPDVKKNMGFFSTQLKAQLLFLPVYLLLMYVGLSIINGSQLLDQNALQNISSATGTNWLLPYIIIAVNFAIVIGILNLPLVVGLSMGGWSTELTKKYRDKFNALSIWKNIGRSTWNNTGVAGKNLGSSLIRDTGGRLANKISKNDTLRDLTSNRYFGKVAEVALKSAKSAGSGYSKNLDEQIKKRTEFADSLGFNKSVVSDLQARLKRLKDDQAGYRISGDVRAADRMKPEIEAIEKQINDEKNRRKLAYAGKLKDRNVDTLWMKLTKNVEAGQKIQGGILKTQLEKANESLKKTREDIKSRNERIAKDRSRIIDSGRPESPEQMSRRIVIEGEITGLMRKERELMNTVAEIESQVND